MKRNNRSKKSAGAARIPRNPPPIPQLKEMGPVVRTLRYTCVNAQAIAIGADELVFAAGGICTVTNSSIRAMNAAVQIKRVRIWAPLSSTTAPSALSTSVCLLWGQGITSDTATPQMQTVATTLSSVHPAYIDSRPPKGANATFWNSGTSNLNLFQIYSYGAAGSIQGVPVGTIVEVTASFQPAVLGPVNFRTITLGTLGQVYYLTLDNAGSGVMLPVGLPTTA